MDGYFSCVRQNSPYITCAQSGCVFCLASSEAPVSATFPCSLIHERVVWGTVSKSLAARWVIMCGGRRH
jgi:hypothetical protein